VIERTTPIWVCLLSRLTCHASRVMRLPLGLRLGYNQGSELPISLSRVRGVAGLIYHDQT